MSSYLQQEFDFVDRTRIILRQYEDFGLAPKKRFEVTLLINCLVGLLIMPQQNWIDSLPNDEVSKKEWGIDKSYISIIKGHGVGPAKKKIVDEAKTVKNVCRHMRNAVSHIRFKAFDNSKKDISQIKFEDFTDKTKKIKTFEATIPIDALRKFVDRLSSQMLTKMKDA